MSDLSISDIEALAKAVDVDIPEHLLIEVGHSLNGLLEALEAIPNCEWSNVEALPILIETQLKD